MAVAEPPRTTEVEFRYSHCDPTVV